HGPGWLLPRECLEARVRAGGAGAHFPEVIPRPRRQPAKPWVPPAPCLPAAARVGVPLLPASPLAESLGSAATRSDWGRLSCRFAAAGRRSASCATWCATASG